MRSSAALTSSSKICRGSLGGNRSWAAAGAGAVLHDDLVAVIRQLEHRLRFVTRQVRIHRRYHEEGQERADHEPADHADHRRVDGQQWHHDDQRHHPR